MSEEAKTLRRISFSAALLSFFSISGAALVYLLFQDEAVFAKRYLQLVVGVSFVLTAVDIRNKDIPLELKPLLRRWVNYLSSFAFSLLMLVVVLPIAIAQVIIGPISIFGAVLSFCCVIVSFLEEILGYDIVSVDVAKEGPSFLLSSSVLVFCGLCCGLSYLIHQNSYLDKLYALLGEAIRDLRPLKR